MNYAKPEISVVASANSAIQGQHKAPFTGFDSLPSIYQTLGAYEADE